MESQRNSTGTAFIIMWVCVIVCVCACTGEQARVCDCGILMPPVFLPTSDGASWAWTACSFSAAWYNNLAFKGNEDQLWRCKQSGD